MSSDPLDPQDWRAPGTEPEASPRVTAVLERLDATLSELDTLSLMHYEIRVRTDNKVSFHRRT